MGSIRTLNRIAARFVRSEANRPFYALVGITGVGQPTLVTLAKCLLGNKNVDCVEVRIARRNSTALTLIRFLERS